jgi:hypothetical protein
MATLFLCFALADTGHQQEALAEITAAGELFARRPGRLTEMLLATARAYVLSSTGRRRRRPGSPPLCPARP